MDEKEVTQSSRDWSNLLPELLELIFKRLIFSDQVRFGSVCKPWFLLASQKPYPPLPELPWLLHRDFGWGLKEQYYEFFSFQEKRTYKVDKLPECPNIGNVRGFFHGWFFSQFNSGHKFYLINPFSKVKIQLPDHLTIPLHITGSHNVAKAVCLSSQQYTIVAVLFPGGRLALCKVGDSKWCGCENLPLYMDITFYNGKLYAMSPTDRVDVFIIDDALSPRLVNKINSLELGNWATDTYLVESGKDLLVVKIYSRAITESVSLFEVFKLKENQTTPQWIKMANLSDQVLLLLARDSCLSVPTEMFPGLKGNQIIFVKGVGDLAVFSLEDGSIKPFPTTISRFPLVYPICIKPMPASRCDL